MIYLPQTFPLECAAANRDLKQVCHYSREAQSGLIAASLFSDQLVSKFSPSCFAQSLFHTPLEQLKRLVTMTKSMTRAFSQSDIWASVYFVTNTIHDQSNISVVWRQPDQLSSSSFFSWLSIRDPSDEILPFWVILRVTKIIQSVYLILGLPLDQLPSTLPNMICFYRVSLSRLAMWPKYSSFHFSKFTLNIHICPFSCLRDTKQFSTDLKSFNLPLIIDQENWVECIELSKIWSTKSLNIYML